jgi:hypothetical protein
MEAWVQPQARICRICDGKSATGRGFPANTSSFPCQYHSTNVPHTFTYYQYYIILATGIIVKQHTLKKERVLLTNMIRLNSASCNLRDTVDQNKFFLQLPVHIPNTINNEITNQLQ